MGLTGRGLVECFVPRYKGHNDEAGFGRKDNEWGEEVVAFVVTEPGSKIDFAALDRHCLEYLARFKRPKAYVVREDLPKNNYGKVLKTELRAILAAGVKEQRRSS